MKTKNIIILLVVVVAIVSIFYSFLSGEASYQETIMRERTEKDEYMRRANDSPFKKNVADFKGLKYFPPDPQYNIIADLVPVQQKKAVILGTSDGKEQHYLEFAYADFKLHGEKQRLLILEITDEGMSKGKLFLAFGDDTSANETYGAGRYLDVERSSGSNTITLDFNKSYNPYCAYNDEFSCPFPPRENILTVAVRAGELNYKN